MKRLIEFLNSKSIAFEENADGSKLCSFRVGGRAALVARPNNYEQIIALFNYLKSEGIKHVVLGRGSNVVIDDGGYDGVIVLLTDMNKIVADRGLIAAGAGVSMYNLACAAEKNGLTGLEFAHGIPGSVGGGVYMNAGAYGGEMREVISACECFDKKSGRIVCLENSDCGFSYRHSVFHDNKDLIILGAFFTLKEGDALEIRSRMNEYKEKRAASQPLEYPSAGSTFKRPEGHFAAKLIDDAGLKGYTIGGAQVSEKHAGFVINRGGATSDDIKKIVEHIKNAVKEKFDVLLECEIEFVE